MRSKPILIAILCIALALIPAVVIGQTDMDGDGWTVEAGDCNDEDNQMYPGAPEVADGKDNDCDGQVDEGLTWYEDGDLDGHGNLYGATLDQYDDPGPGWSLFGDDCDDTDNTVYPGALELIDGQDNDCDGVLDGYEADQDGDGHIMGLIDPDGWDGPGPIPGEGDCDDGDATVYLGAPELIDGQVNDCSGSLHPDEQDQDGDGYIPGYPDAMGWDGPGPEPDGGDCDDGDQAIYPGAPETWYDGVDSDCQADNDFDQDGDGYVAEGWDFMAGGTAPGSGDCDDEVSGIHPGAADSWYDGLDQDCDGWNDYDADMDGFVADFFPGTGGGTSPGEGDCDDAEPTINPDAVEICDGLDNDCDGGVDEGVTTLYYIDADGDGYGDDGHPGEEYCISPGPGWSETNDDCDDGEPTIHPGAPEICDDGLDNDCDGQIDEDCREMAILSVDDVGNDQGRRVRLVWTRPNDDAPGVGLDLTEYNVFRRIDGFKKAVPDEPLNAPPGDWDFVDDVPVSGEDPYYLVVPTLCDSTDAGVCWSVFFVRARTADPYVFIDSQPDSGYSIDNLAPSVPEGLMVAYGSSGNELEWLASDDADFRYFKIYRGDEPGFVVDTDNPLQTTADAAWTDPTGGSGFHYKVSAVDFAGNESAAADPQAIVGIGDGPASLGFALRQNVPNPFNPCTTIEFSLAEPSAVSLRIYDVSGSLVRTLLDGVGHDTGRHESVWDGRDSEGAAAPAGVYLYRIEAAGRSLTKGMVLVK